MLGNHLNGRRDPGRHGKDVDSRTYKDVDSRTYKDNGSVEGWTESHTEKEAQFLAVQ